MQLNPEQLQVSVAAPSSSRPLACARSPWHPTAVSVFRHVPWEVPGGERRDLPPHQPRWGKAGPALQGDALLELPLTTGRSRGLVPSWGWGRSAPRLHKAAASKAISKSNGTGAHKGA